MNLFSLIALFGGLGLLGILAAGGLVRLFRPPVSEWHPVDVMLKKPLVTGDVAGGLLMRSRAEGRWVYRRPTADEVSEYMSRDAW